MLVTDASPMPEICGDAASYCDPYSVDDIAEKIVALLLVVQLQHSLRRRGHEGAKTFSWDRCVQETCD